MTPSLLDLPTFLHWEIIDYLPFESLPSLWQVNQHFTSISRDRNYWKNRVEGSSLNSSSWDFGLNSQPQARYFELWSRRLGTRPGSEEYARPEACLTRLLLSDSSKPDNSGERPSSIGPSAYLVDYFLQRIDQLTFIPLFGGVDATLPLLRWSFLPLSLNEIRPYLKPQEMFQVYFSLIEEDQSTSPLNLDFSDEASIVKLRTWAQELPSVMQLTLISHLPTLLKTYPEVEVFLQELNWIQPAAWPLLSFGLGVSGRSDWLDQVRHLSPAQVVFGLLLRDEVETQPFESILPRLSDHDLDYLLYFATILQLHWRESPVLDFLLRDYQGRTRRPPLALNEILEYQDFGLLRRFYQAGINLEGITLRPLKPLLRERLRLEYPDLN